MKEQRAESFPSFAAHHPSHNFSLSYQFVCDISLNISVRDIHFRICDIPVVLLVVLLVNQVFSASVLKKHLPYSARRRF